jgi:hypothetical protein
MSQGDTPIYGYSDAGYQPGYPATHELEAQQYITHPGTVDLSKRQIIDNNAEGYDPRNYGSEYSARDELPTGHIMSYPTIYDGAVHDRKEAYHHAIETNQHLGIFAPGTPEHVMDEYEDTLHSRPIYLDKQHKQQLSGDVWAGLKRGKQYVSPWLITKPHYHK